ncbi:MAG: hypothetical protein ACXAB7_22075 [Candidatus Kariarchaeaceae archaeon]|jgi:hypothetical protein
MRRKQLQLKNRRGQLQIAETLVSVSLMLILALLLINTANQVNNPHSNIINLQQTASDILLTADEAGLLRPVVFLYDQSEYTSDYTASVKILGDFIDSILTANIDFALRMRTVVDQVVTLDYIYLIGSQSSIVALQQGSEGIIANYYVGSFSSAIYGNFADHYLIDLYLWEKV